MLTLEGFKSQDENGVPKYNNFYLYFAPGEYFSKNKSQNFYKKFEVENELLVAQLRSAFSNILNIEKEDRSKYIESYINSLYESYAKMSKYGATDKDLLEY